MEIINVRQRLALMPKDGFYLNSESPSFWNKERNAVFLRQSHIESAGRMALFRDFDLLHFDAFCLTLYVEQGTDSKKRYQMLCDWILELSERLINPAFITQDELFKHTGCTTISIFLPSDRLAIRNRVPADFGPTLAVSAAQLRRRRGGRL